MITAESPAPTNRTSGDRDGAQPQSTTRPQRSPGTQPLHQIPEGRTSLGQFRDGSVIIQEKSKVLILLYPLTDHIANREIEEIRQAYKDQLQQQPVLRVDTRERVSF
jgi:hypothetical protein